MIFTVCLVVSLVSLILCAFHDVTVYQAVKKSKNYAFEGDAAIVEQAKDSFQKVKNDVNFLTEKIDTKFKQNVDRTDRVETKLNEFKNEIGHNGIAEAIKELQKTVGQKDTFMNHSSFWTTWPNIYSKNVEYKSEPTIIERLEALESFLKIDYVNDTRTVKGYKKAKSTK